MCETASGAGKLHPGPGNRYLGSICCEMSAVAGYFRRKVFVGPSAVSLKLTDFAVSSETLMV